MQGYTHWLSAALLGVGSVTLVFDHPTPAQAVIYPLVCAGAGYALDLDHQSATIAQTFGWPTKKLAKLVSRIARGHRGLTHTHPGVAAFGLVALLLELTGWAAGWIAARAGASPGWAAFAGSSGQHLAAICCLGLSVRALGFSDDSHSHGRRRRRGPRRPSSSNAVTSLCTFGIAAAFVSVTAASGFSYRWVPVAVVVGCYAHLLGDMCTEQGVMFWWPLSERRIRVMTLDTGKWPERLIVAPLLAAGIYLASAIQLGYGPQLAAVAHAIAAAITT